jgi:hemolysin D
MFRKLLLAAEIDIGRRFSALGAARDEREFLPADLEITETPPSPIAQGISITIILAIAIAIAWAFIGKTDITATARGHVVPVGKTKVVQPLQEGVVTAIHVNDGDHVAAGTPLLELDLTSARADLAHYRTDLEDARLDQARFLGLIAGFDGGPIRLVDPPADADPAEIERARLQLEAQASQHAAKMQDLEGQILGKQAEAREAAASHEKAQAAIPMLQNEADMREKLKDMQFGNKVAWFEAEDRLIEREHDLPVYTQQEQQAAAEAASLTAQRAEAEAAYRGEIFDNLAHARAQISELTADLAKTEDALRRGVLRAPISGTVQQLAVHTVGGVVTPAQTLMMIVPDHPGLEVEAVIENRDIGFVEVGQKARVKIDTFNFTRYGIIDGTVEHISRDILDQRSENPGADTGNAGNADAGGGANNSMRSGYMAELSLSRDWMTTESGRVALEPGMTVTVEISTGKRRIIDYLLSPLTRRINESLQER